VHQTLNFSISTPPHDQILDPELIFAVSEGDMISMGNLDVAPLPTAEDSIDAQVIP
jgi:hypothetical protein